MWGMYNIAAQVAASFYTVKNSKQRMKALFLFIVITLGMALAPVQAALAVANSESQAGKALETASPPALEQKPSKFAPAADVNTSQTNALTLDKSKADREKTLNPGKQVAHPRELTEKRTATSKKVLNKDGTITETVYSAPHFYKEGSQWKEIDTTLKEDGKNPFTGWFSDTTYSMAANDWQARFASSNNGDGMVRLEKNGQTVSFKPVDAANIKPEITKDETGRQVVTYKDLWPSIDVEYRIRNNQLKEFVLLNNASAKTNYAFTVGGASLTPNSKEPGSFKLTGELADKFEVAPLSVSLMKRGVISEEVATQKFENGQLKVQVDGDWLKAVPEENWPVVIDPTFVNRFDTNYESFKSDGYGCNASTCYPNAGSLNDGSGWKNWRTMMHMPYTSLQGKNLKSAVFHLQQMPPASGHYYGTYNTYTYVASHAKCHGYNCIDTTKPRPAVSMSTSGDFNVTSIYQSLISENNWGGWLMVNGPEGTTETLKMFDPDNSYMTYDYYVAPPAPTIASPANGQTFTDPQVSFRVNKATNPNSTTTPLQYEFKVTTGSDGQTGTVIDSGYVNAAQWTIPDGVLQDGSTYYLSTYSYDPVYQVRSVASAVKSFKIDMRQGKDKTQTADDIGPVSVDLATGNLSTSASSHSSKALGGDLGVSLDYNSPVKSRPGLVGEYWKVANGYSGGTPTTNPDLTRIDQTVDFDWDTGNPGGNITSDWFASRWSGYFVAPAAGTYYFGGTHDDSLTLTVNNQQLYSGTGCQTTVCYGSSITLSAGQVVSFKAEYQENAASANARLFVKGPVDEQVIPQKWLQTGVRPIANNHGLTGRYYRDDGSHTMPTSTADAFLSRTDSILSFDWAGGSPVPNGPTDNYIVRWNGYITVPVTGNYQFGTSADDGSRVTINGQQVYNDWQDGLGEGYGTSISLSAGQTVPITVDYYEHTGYAQFFLKVQGAVDNQVVPTEWLSPKAQVLPEGWNLGIDPDGNTSYDHLSANHNSVTLTDSSGDTHEYLWTGGGYKPPVNEDGQLSRNNDGTFTLIDSDGRTYIFNQEGYLQSLTNPDNDKKPTALQYTYSGTPAKITKIADGVDSNRFAAIYYSGDSNCTSAPSGFDANAPANMLCAVKTNDGLTTSFFYKNSKLARIVTPGNATTDYQYDTLGRIVGIRDVAANDTLNAGLRSDDDSLLTQVSYDALGRATGVTQPAATANATRQAQTIEYLPGAPSGSYAGKTNQHITGAPEPNGFSRSVTYDDTFRTLTDTDTLGLTDTTVWDATKDLQLSTTDEKGLTSTIIYDDSDRPVSSYGPAPSSWFGSDRKPLAAYTNQVSRTDTAYDEGMTGLAVTYASVTKPGVQDTLANTKQMIRGQAIWSQDRRFQYIYQTDGNIVLYRADGVAIWNSGTSGRASDHLVMQTDGNLVLYNGASAVWYTGTNGGSSSRLVVQNDGNAVVYTAASYTWQSNTGGYAPGGVSPATLSGVPFWHSTNIGSSSTQISNNFGSTSPDSSITANWGMTMTGKIRLPATGNYNFRINSDGGVRVWIDDALVLDDWVENTTIRNHPTFSYNNATANEPHRVRIQYFHTSSTASFSLYMTPPGGSETANVAGYFSPDYNLETSTTAYDNTIGNSTATTSYGTRPELGLATSTTVDATGVNLSSTSAYEPYGSTNSLLRQISSSLPGGATTNYSYYGASETRDNPCTTATEAYRQAGMAKIVTDADPDGDGPQTGIATETVYDDSGDVVATRVNNDSWTCTTYDSRGRVTEVNIPSYNSKPARTLTYNYAVNGNPLVSSKSDAQGTITTTVDLLGRTVSYTDTNNKTTTTTYDSLGRVASETSPLGTQTLSYNNYGQLTEQKLDNVSMAVPTYDQYGRMNHISYPSAGITEDINFNSLGATASQTYTLADTTVISDSATYSQSGRILSATASTGSSATAGTWNYTYDKAGRLTGATKGSDSYTYGFGAQDASCTSGTNANSGKSSNRTSMVKNGQTTTYCYDHADRLISSSDPTVTAAQYDTHGNTTSLGDSTHLTTFEYDSSDRSSKIAEGNKSTTYTRDVTDRITTRTTNNGTTTTGTLYSFTSDSDTPDMALDGNGTVVEKYLTLPGDLQLTIRPASTSASHLTASLPNLHGDTLATVNADGSVTGTFSYDPFGVLVGSSAPAQSGNGSGSGDHPLNTTNNASFGWEGQNIKATETNLSLNPIQMGARIYLASLGRFLQTDPVRGGTPNSYVYPTDPVNQEDLNGQWSLWGGFQKAAKWAWGGVKKAAKWAWRNRDELIAVGSVVACVASVIGCAIASGVSMGVSAYSAYKSARSKGANKWKAGFSALGAAATDFISNKIGGRLGKRLVGAVFKGSKRYLGRYAFKRSVLSHSTSSFISYLAGKAYGAWGW